MVLVTINLNNKYMITYGLFIIGFAILIYGAKLLIDGASSLGTRAGLPQLIIGLSIVALGTSLPELVINVFASINGSTGLAIGNVLGSNIMNTLFIVGVTAIIYPIKVSSKVIKRDSTINLIAILIMAVLANDFLFGKSVNSIDQVDGIILLFLFAVLLYILFSDKSDKEDNTEEIVSTKSIPVSLLLIVAGIAGLFFGGRWIVAGATAIANDLGVSESTIGLTLVAIATSLPELVTSIIAALNKKTDIAIGNALGSNVFNIFLVLGTSAAITPIKFDTGLNLEIGILIASSLFLLTVILVGSTKRTITRIEGILLSIIYLSFLTWSII